MNKQRIELFFYMAFLMLALVVMPLFTELQKRVKNKHRTVSILKLCSFVRSNMEAFISGENAPIFSRWLNTIAYMIIEKNGSMPLNKSFFIILRLTRMQFIETHPL